MKVEILGLHEFLLPRAQEAQKAVHAEMVIVRLSLMPLRLMP